MVGRCPARRSLRSSDGRWTAYTSPGVGLNANLAETSQIPKETRDLIRTMSRDNPLWGAPRIHGELLKLGIPISQASVAKYMVRSPKPSSQSWTTFLDNHVSQLASIDFFTVHTISFQVLFVFVILAHDRRRVLHFNVTAHPTAEWTAQQILEAFPFDTAPKYFVARP